MIENRKTEINKLETVSKKFESYNWCTTNSITDGSHPGIWEPTLMQNWLLSHTKN